MSEITNIKLAKKGILALGDGMCYLFAVFVSLWITTGFGDGNMSSVMIYSLVKLAYIYPAFAVVGFYTSVWKYADFSHILKLVCVLLVMFVCDCVMFMLHASYDLKTAIVLIFVFFTCELMMKFGYGWAYRLGRVRSREHDKPTKNIMIIGAGEAGYMLIREFKSSDKTPVKPVCLIDDDPSKWGRDILGVKIVGGTKVIPQMVSEYHPDEIYIAIPTASNSDRKRIVGICQQCEVKTRIIPGMFQFASGEAIATKFRDVSIEDLLGRDQIKVDGKEISRYIQDKVVMITGGGGSIGSELSRQIAKNSPKQLIIFDVYENNAYEIEQELKRKYPNLDVVALIASVRDRGRLESVFNTYKPQIIFNAAAHKHVPLMETSPHEAIKNNVLGTFNVSEIASKHGVETFVQISTDKAVNPTNVMGASKRICEMIIQSIGRKSKTKFVAVRFGNVLGSNGSVIPLFKKQIEEGGPVTVTHKDIIRYFMTIPEAVQLVLQAGAYAQGGEIYVLDMGEQVRIYDLAEKLIKLSGYTPNEEIEIKITGLRPGEKLFEERLMAEEGMTKTANEMISIGKPLQFNDETFYHAIEEMKILAYDEDSDIKASVKNLVPTYIYQETLEKPASKSGVTDEVLCKKNNVETAS
ncbi:MAG: nucleoside-diphosphate sugar epimerase/dehydratase [Bacillota bacterium]